MLRNSVDQYAQRAAFKIKKEGKFVPITYEELYQKIKSFGTGLVHIGQQSLDHIALVSENRLEWMISDMAITGIRGTDVPCSGNSSARDIEFKLTHSDANAVILEGEKQFVQFYQIQDKLPKIKNVILMDKIKVFSEKEETPEWAIPVSFKHQHHVTQKFQKALKNLIKHQNTYLFISPKAKQFLQDNWQHIEKELNTSSVDHKQGKSDYDHLAKRLIMVEPKNQKKPYQIYSFQYMIQLGKKHLAEGDNVFDTLSKQVQPDDLATIIYTSGTTSDPKGVMLTHANFMHNVRVTPPVQEINQYDRFLSILPSWHIFERTAEYITLSAGASTAYSKPFKQILIPDLSLEKPTIMISVPRIWESVYKGIMDKSQKAKGLQKTIFNWAINMGEKYKKAERMLTHTLPLFDRLEYSAREIAEARRSKMSLGWQYQLADRLVYRKIRSVTGGQLRFAISGGGALPDNVDNFFDIVGIMVCEGYGLTETSPVLSARNPKYCTLSTVGSPLPEVELKIVDKDNTEKELPNGEIGTVLAKGPMVMKGYYKNEKKTAEVIRDNWFNTGDLGRKTKNGQCLQLVGRSKDTIVLRGGENVEPQPLEERLKESPYVNMVIIVGQDKPRLGALIVPNFNALQSFWEQEKIQFKNWNELIKHPKIISLFQNEIKRLISREYGFMPYETVMGVALHAQEFTVENGELTETLKMKRFEIHRKFAQVINRICG